MDRTTVLYTGGADHGSLLARDAPSFDLIQTMVAMILIVFVAAVAFWPEQLRSPL